MRQKTEPLVPNTLYDYPQWPLYTKHVYKLQILPTEVVKSSDVITPNKHSPLDFLNLTQLTY